MRQRSAHLPGGCWVRVGEDKEASGGTVVEVGSIAPEAAEVKSVSHVYSPSGALSKVMFSKVTALEEEE